MAPRQINSQISFETPENIQVEYDLAGLGSRFAAWALDQFLVTIVVIVAFIALLVTGTVSETIVDDLFGIDESDSDEVPAYVTGIFLLLYSLGAFFYFGLCELYMRGQTVGKRKLGLRVVQANGFELHPTSILLRSVFRVIDHLPPLWIVPFVTNRQCRLGDLVAGTVVVCDRPSELSNVRRTILDRPTEEAGFRFGNSISKLEANEVQVMERFMERLPSLAQDQKMSLLHSIVTPLAQRFDMEVPAPDLQEQFVRELLAAYYQKEYRRLG